MVSSMSYPHEAKENTTMLTEINLEEMSKEYGLACVKAVQDTIHKLVLEWGDELVDTLKENGFEIITELYDGAFCVEAYIGKDGYYELEKYADADINAGVQEAFDNLLTQVKLTAMIWEGLESAEQVIFWEIA